ncbi:MAG: SoxR reducing system RseC family protein [Candidatus Aegiribacteria sp.]
MTREAIVREVRDGQALVCPVDTSECSACEARHACMTLSGGKREERSIWVANEVGAAPGDKVRLELKSAASLAIIAATFLIPVLLLFAGYLLMMGGPDADRAAGAGGGLLLGIIAAVIVNRRLGASRNYNMQIVKILERADGSTAPGGGRESHMEG